MKRGMRITGGLLRGRRFLVPRGVRAAQGMIREAVFSSIAGKVAGARVLDLYAGSGAYGLEARSRGAAFVCWVERDREACRVLRENVTDLCGGAGLDLEIACYEVLNYIRRYKGAPFDLIFADPPYLAARSGLQERTLRALAAGSILGEQGLILFEQAAGGEVPGATGLKVLRVLRHGGTQVVIYGHG